MTDTADVAERKKRFRSPAYPALDLAKAVERTASLMKVAQHHAAGVPAILPAWGMDSDAGPVWRYLAALIQYGLVTDSGGGKARKFQITDMARRIIQDGDQNSKKRKEALKTAALSPTIHKELWEKFGSAAGLSDSVLKVYLTLDRKEAGESPYSETAASEVIQAYKSTLEYAGIFDSDSVSTSDVDKGSLKVDALSGEGAVMQTALKPAHMSPAHMSGAAPSMVSLPIGRPRIVMNGDHLDIQASVDLAGLRQLQTMLQKYEEILEMMEPKKDEAAN